MELISLSNEFQPFFSVVIATYNKPEMLARALNSLADQTYTNFEVIVIDDYSDSCLEYDSWHKIFQLKCYKNSRNMGVSFSRNYGIEKSQGKWIIFLDDDDEFMPEILYRHHSVLKDKSVDEVFAWCGIESISRKNDQKKEVSYLLPLENYRCEDELVGNSLSIGIGYGVAIGRETLFKVGLFDTEMASGEDTDLLMSLVSLGIKPIPLSYVGIRVNVHSDKTLSRNLKVLLEHNVKARLIGKHHKLLRRYPYVWPMAGVSQALFMLSKGAFRSTVNLLRVVFSVGYYGWLDILLLLLIFTCLPVFWLYSFLTRKDGYDTRPLSEEFLNKISQN